MRLLNCFHINTEYEGQIDITRIREKLTDYLEPCGPANHRIDEVFGVNEWKRIEIYIEKTEENGIDIRHIRAYTEHKGIVDKRLKCLCKYEYLLDQSLCTACSKIVLKEQRNSLIMCLEYFLARGAEL